MAVEAGHRRSIRLRGYDYTRRGAYFVTVCTQDRRRLFGTVVNGRMVLNDAGRMVKTVWDELPGHYPGVDVDEFVVMPDHIHGVVRLTGVGAGPCACPACDGVGFAGDGVVTGVGAGPCACPAAAWEGQAQGPAHTVVSGFLSPMERAVFEACLADGTPMVQVLARGLPAAFPPRVQHAIDAGRLLVITPFPPEVTGFSTPRAAWCNQYVLHAACEVVIGQLAPDGMLACLLADLPDDKPVTVLKWLGQSPDEETAKA